MATPNAPRKTGTAGTNKPHNEPTQPNEVGQKGGKAKQGGPKPHNEPTQPNEV